MSSFICVHCGAFCIEWHRGYVTGCRHYPPDSDPTPLQLEALLERKSALEGKILLIGKQTGEPT